MLFLTIIILVSFSLSFGYLFYDRTKNSRIMDIERNSIMAVAGANNLNALTKDLLIRQDHIDKIFTDWRRSFRDFQEVMNKFKQYNRESLILPKDIKSHINDTVALWNFTEEQLVKMDSLLKEIEEQNEEYGGYISNRAAEMGLLSHIVKASYNNDFYKKGGVAIQQMKNQVTLISYTNPEFNNAIQQLSSQMRAYSDKQEQRSTLISLAVFTAVIIFGILVMFRFSQGVSRRIVKIEGSMRRVAEKDLTVRTSDTKKDEISHLGQNINQVIETLQHFINTAQEASHKAGELKDSIGSSTEETSASISAISKHIDGITEQFSNLDNDIEEAVNSVGRISGSVKDLATRISRQSDSIDSSSSSIEQMSASIDNVAKLSEEHRSRAEQLQRITRRGGEQVENTRTIIESISHEISNVMEIIEIINSVSEQTNLLSMNAAIESAHAGEAGKGFAVVSEEIRQLADQTAEYSNQVDTSLKSMINKIEEATTASNTSSRSFDNISKEIISFGDAMAEIASSMNELSTGSNEILKETNEVADITSFISDGSQSMQKESEQVLASIQELKGISSRVISGIKEIEEGAREILTSMKGIQGLSESNKEQMEELESVMNSFITE